MSYLRGALFGQYPEQGWSENADCVLGLSFGDAQTSFSVDTRLAHMAAIHAGDSRPLILDEALAEALPDWMGEPALVIPSVLSSPFRNGRSTWGNLTYAARHYMDVNGLERPLLIAQAHHVGRAAMQVAKLGFEPIVPSGLPTDFDPQADHIWPRSQPAWAVHELLAFPLLKLRGQL